MTTKEVKRKLTAILNANVRRYSCLTGAAERETVSGPKTLNPCLFDCSVTKKKKLRKVCSPDP